MTASISCHLPRLSWSELSSRDCSLERVSPSHDQVLFLVLHVAQNVVHRVAHDNIGEVHSTILGDLHVDCVSVAEEVVKVT